MAHSCGKFSLKQLFARSEPEVWESYRRYAEIVRACGRVRTIPQKTRVVFQVRMRFAGATPRKSALICHFILPYRVKDGRFEKIETYGPRCHGHYLRIQSPADLDRAVTRWLKQAYAVGRQEF
jgi:hypothetical protein